MLLVTPVYRVELSLNLAIVILVAVIIAGYLLVRTLAVTMSMPARVREFNKRRAEKKTRQAFGDAVRTYFEGRFGKTERAVASVLSRDPSAGLAMST